MTGALRIETGARLHFGPLSYRPECGRHFGGIGLMIASPGVRLIATPHDSLEVFHDRAHVFAQTVASNLRFDPKVQLKIDAEIPSHRGLGSGTQLGLAVAEAVCEISGASERNPVRLAELSGRGARSAIGIHGYQQGGFFVDAGQRGASAIGEIACRLEFPEEWPILLIAPQQGKGISGSAEAELFAEISPMDETRSGRLCRLALTELLPAISQHDFESWSTALWEYGMLVGEFFRTTQGGVFSDSRVANLVEHLRKCDVRGIAQSSWGPTIAVFCEDIDRSTWLSEKIRQQGDGWEILETRGKNTGRTIQRPEHSPL